MGEGEGEKEREMRKVREGEKEWGEGRDGCKELASVL